MMALDDVSVGISDRALTHVAGYSALAGLCPLIPIPFVDDFIIVRIQRRLYQVIATQHDFYLSVDGAKTLTERPSTLLTSTFKKLVLWPVKKIVTKLVYFLAVKSCADVAATVFHEGWLFAHALERRYVSLDALARGDQRAIEQLRDAIVEAREHVDPSPTQQAMRSAFGVGREVFGGVLRSIRGVLSKGGSEEARLDAAEHEAAPIAHRIQSEIRKHWSNGPALDAALRRALQVDV